MRTTTRLAAAGMLALGLAAAAHGATPPPPTSSDASSWAEAQIELVTSFGLLGGDAQRFRPDDAITAGDLAVLISGLGGTANQPDDPSAPVSIVQLDALLVRGLGLAPAARSFATAAHAAGLEPPPRFGTEVVARLLGLRVDHPQDSLEPGPTELATRAEAAYSAAKVLGWQGWERQYVQDLSMSFAPPAVEGWQQTLLKAAVSLVGYPYVFAGISEKPQTLQGIAVPGGFDCSGFVWRVYKTAHYAVGTDLAATLRGRTTFALSAEVPRARRIGFTAVEPADLVFFGPRGPRSKPAEIGHMGVYIGGGWMVHASVTGVTLSPIASEYYRERFAWARRPLVEAGFE